MKRQRTVQDAEQDLQWLVEGAAARVLRASTRSEARRQMRALAARVSALEQYVLGKIAMQEQARAAEREDRER